MTSGLNKKFLGQYPKICSLMIRDSVTLKEPVKFKIHVPENVDDNGIEREKYIFFQESNHTLPPGRPCFIVLAGSTMVFENVTIPDEPICLVTYGAGLPEISSDGLEISLVFKEALSGMEHLVFKGEVKCFDRSNQWFEEKIDIGGISGKVGEFQIECLPGADNDPSADWLAIYEFVISSADELNLNRARAFQILRERNEIAHFSNVYDHSLYQNGESEGRNYAVVLMTQLRRGGLCLKRSIIILLRQPEKVIGLSRYYFNELMDMLVRLLSKDNALCQPEVNKGTANPDCAEKTPPLNAYAYYTKQLMMKLGMENTNFHERLFNLVESNPDRKVRLLSLASGAARIEEKFLSGLDGERVELTLVDINPQLVAEAASRFEGQVTVNCLLQNINEIELDESSYDVIMCVSALHHVVELEHLAKSIKAALVDGGEFWSIGEYVGRNGTCLYDEAYDVANSFFSKLPEKYRVNRNFGSLMNIDTNLPNDHCALSTFEGIRSEDILPILRSEFEEVEAMTFDCFLWRLFNLAYLDNYDLEKPEDKALIDEAIDIEADYYKAGGAPTAYFGVFKKV